jgi:hypothetical protein
MTGIVVSTLKNCNLPPMGAAMQLFIHVSTSVAIVPYLATLNILISAAFNEFPGI